MPALSFKKQFAQPIWDETKVGTIRAKRKVPIKVGQPLFLYTGMRTKQCKKIGERRAIHVVPIRILPAAPDQSTPRVIYGGEGAAISGRLATSTDLDHFARGDGFASWDDMCAFWHKEHPESKAQWFDGDWILWSAPRV